MAPLFQPDLTPEQHRQRDELRTGRGRCIGCGRFLPDTRDWNQCADCDTRTHEDY